jgi:hypothetical protein
MAELRSLTERQFSAGRCSEADCQQAAPKPTFNPLMGSELMTQLLFPLLKVHSARHELGLFGALPSLSGSFNRDPPAITCEGRQGEWPRLRRATT